MRLTVPEVSHSAERANIRGEQVGAAWQGVASYGAFSIYLHDQDYRIKKMLSKSVAITKFEG